MCQSPIHRDTHFYDTRKEENVNIFLVSIPYTSGHPFLHMKRTRNIHWLISLCQSPIHRDTHFYFQFFSFLNRRCILCQSPIHRDTHFYSARRYSSSTRKESCVNPLYIGTPISTEMEKGIVTHRNVSIPYTSGHGRKKGGDYVSSFMCQSPIHRDTHFYKSMDFWATIEHSVSIPYTSGHPFLRPHRPLFSHLSSLSCQSPIHRDTHFYIE